MTRTPLAAALARDRIVVAASLALLVLLAWLYLFRLAGEMTSMVGAMGDVMDMPSSGAPGAAGEPLWADAAADFAILTAMWVVMMVGMMLPSAAPTILLFSALEQTRAAGGMGRTTLFVSGYVIVWSGFSLVAAALQTAQSHAGLMSMQMATEYALLGGAVFILAGVYELTPLKRRCLTHCRSPLEWLPRHSRAGGPMALRTGVEHGVCCLGCCWALMLLLFVGGVMNLLWVAAIAGIVLAQKLLPRGEWISRLGGLALILCGIWIAIEPF